MEANNANEGNPKQTNFSSGSTSIRFRDDLKPTWLEDFLSNTSFDSCTTHALPRNELNKYCVDCNVSFCKYCASLGTHHDHQVLKIYRYNYREAVLLSSMTEHFDCSQIQPYKCNNQELITLKPLPYHRQEKKNEALSCVICTRKLIKPNIYRYCSISCKVEYDLRKPNDSNSSFISTESQSLQQEKKEEITESPKRRNKRKGTPCRAPLF